MKEYKCNRCGKLYNNKYDFGRHKNRKKPCEIDSSISAIISQKNDQNILIKSNTTNKPKINKKKICSFVQVVIKECEFCSKYFNKKSNLDRHLKTCKYKIIEQDNEKEEIFKKLLEKLEQIEKQNEELKIKMIQIETKTKINKKINNKSINNGTINNSIDNSKNINIQLVAFGKENYDKLTDKEYQIIINKGFKSVQEMVKSLHFNKNRPENHNIYISNIRDNYVMIYDGNKWQLRNRKETIEELYIAKKDILVDKFDELLNKLPEYVIDKFERFINDSQDDKIKDRILEELKLMLYNNKNIPLKTKERLGLLK